MATYAIGDIQGCFASLLALLDAIAFDRSRDQLWLTGDLVNRGPQSLAVLRFVKDLGDRAVTVLGNHDLHLIAVAHDRGYLKPKDTFQDVLDAPDCSTLLAWLRQQPLLHHDAALGMTMVHAGLPPQWSLAKAQACAAEVAAVLQSPDLPVFLAHLETTASGQQTCSREKWPRLCYISNCLSRLRYCDAQGRLDLHHTGPPGSQPAPYVPWFAVPGRASASLNLVFGHWATLNTATPPGVYHLDTGCVWGGTLTAMCLETRARISIACREAGAAQDC
jgi:bis(5'-nucleosyl)-tetraphosphatase (symmetrical)